MKKVLLPILMVGSFGLSKAQYNRDVEGVFVNSEHNDTIKVKKKGRDLSIKMGGYNEKTLITSVDFKSYGVYLFFTFRGNDRVILLHKENENKIGLVVDFDINQYGRPVMISDFYYKINK